MIKNNTLVPDTINMIRKAIYVRKGNSPQSTRESQTAEYRNINIRKETVE